MCRKSVPVFHGPNWERTAAASKIKFLLVERCSVVCNYLPEWRIDLWLPISLDSCLCCEDVMKSKLVYIVLMIPKIRPKHGMSDVQSYIGHMWLLLMQPDAMCSVAQEECLVSPLLGDNDPLTPHNTGRGMHINKTFILYWIRWDQSLLGQQVLLMSRIIHTETGDIAFRFGSL